MARQRLGQHFLTSQHILERIAIAACGDHCPLVIEIGPGKGALTSHLLGHGDRVIALELDRELAAELPSRCSNDPKLEVIEGDALAIDWAQFGPAVFAGNLPYYAATPLMQKCWNAGPELALRGVFLIQAEVAARLTAKPGNRDYGYLSVEAQLMSHVDSLFRVKPGSFSPPPKVDSAVVRIVPKIDGPVQQDERAPFLKFVGICFRQKRKTLRNNLAAAYSRGQIESLDIGSRRAEELTILEFAALYRALVP